MMVSHRITKISPLGGDEPRIRLWFDVGAADPALHDPSLQHELKQIETRISQKDPGVQSQASLQKSAEGASWLTGQFAVVWSVAGPALAGILVAWINGRVGRKVKIKIGEVEAEAQSPEDVERLLALVIAYKEEHEKR